MIAIEVQVYGDFDMPLTVAVMVAPESWRKADVSAQCKVMENTYANTRESDKAIAELKRLGFKPLKTYDMAVGGNL